MVTTPERAFDGPETLTTIAAFVVSAALFVREGHPYLARGVVGDLAGLGILAFVVAWRRRRLRHEALFCLAWIGVVHVADPAWPVSIPGEVWWSAVAGASSAYVAARTVLLA